MVTVIITLIPGFVAISYSLHEILTVLTQIAAKLDNLNKLEDIKDALGLKGDLYDVLRDILTRD